MHSPGTPLKALLLSLASIPEAEWLWLQARLKARVFAPGDVLFRPGVMDAGIHFIQQGLVRYFYLTEDGLERNHTFAAEGNLTGCLPTFAGGEPCSFTVEAIEATRTLEIPSSVFLSLDDRHPCWLRLKLKLAQHVALRKEAREADFLLDSAETRYRRFLADHAKLAERIPLYHIASWLGITPVALSRIRRRLNPG